MYKNDYTVQPSLCSALLLEKERKKERERERESPVQIGPGPDRQSRPLPAKRCINNSRHILNSEV